MKRRLIWTAAIFLASGATAVASGPALVTAQGDAEINPEVSFSPSDEPLSDPLLAEPASARREMNSTTWSAGAGAGCGCGMSVQCCERVPSPLDSVWDCYCQQKSHVHPASKLLGLLHVERHCPCDCPPPACNGCDCRFGLPTLALPAAKAPCASEPCATYCRPRRSILGCFRKPACCEGACDSLPPEALLSSGEMPPADPGLTPPEPVSPPGLPLPDAAPAPEEQGWLPLPWLKRLPL